jgi:outer membrane autotransporter protein
VAETANQLSSATYLESLSSDPALTRLTNQILNLNATDARSAFAQVAGDGLIEFGRISGLQTSRFMDSLANRLGGGVPGGGSYGIAQDLDLQPMPYGDAEFFQSASLTRGMWMRSFGLKGSMDGDGNAIGSDWRGSGTAVGVDAPISSRLLLGASFLYGRDVVDLQDGRAGAARIKAPQAAAYGSYSSAGDNRTGWQVRGLVGYAQPTISSDRYVTIGEHTSVASSKHDGREWSASGQAEISQNMGRYRLHGMLGLRASRLNEAGFTETGSLADLDVSGRATQSLTSSVGARLVVPTYRNQGLIDIRAIWNRQFASSGSVMTAKLAEATSDARFVVNGLPAERDSLLLGAGFSGQLKRNLSFYADYSLELGGDGQRQNTGLAGLRLVW